MTQRCSHDQCRKKLTITDIGCKCGKRFCMNHRLPMEHACTTLEQDRIDHQIYLQEVMKKSAFQKVHDI